MGKPVACEHHVEQTDFGKVEIFSTLTKKLYLKKPPPPPVEEKDEGGEEEDKENKRNKNKKNKKAEKKEPLKAITLENGAKTDFGLRTQRRAQIETAGKKFFV